jgi:putative addiction module component (TIGR02574 family)
MLARRSVIVIILEDVRGGQKDMYREIASIFHLSAAEKLQLVEALWDDLAATPDAVPVHEWQKEELDRRKVNLMKNPAAGCSWEEIKRRIRSR